MRHACMHACIYINIVHAYALVGIEPYLDVVEAPYAWYIVGKTKTVLNSSKTQRYMHWVCQVIGPPNSIFHELCNGTTPPVHSPCAQICTCPVTEISAQAPNRQRRKRFSKNRPGNLFFFGPPDSILNFPSNGTTPPVYSLAVV